jgi:hypothetical protein
MCGRDVRTPAESEREETGSSTAPERSESRQHPLIPAMEARFTIPIGEEKADLRTAYRAKLSSAIHKLRALSQGYVSDPGDGTQQQWIPPRHILLKSVEGIGKTRAHEVLISHEILDDAITASGHGKPERFGAFAFRSHDQAEQKASEYRQAFGEAIVIKSFWSHYEEACKAAGEQSSRGDLENSPSGILGEMRRLQPAVFKEMEDRRRALWTGAGAAFNAGTTMVFMSHAMAMRWHHSETTPIWYHSAFDPALPFGEQRHLRDQFRLSKVVFDEPEVDDVLHRMPDALYHCLTSEQAKHPGWSNRHRSERHEIYDQARASSRLGDMGFERFDELMRLDLSKLEAITVDYERIQFGFDQSDSGIYRPKHRERYYLGPQTWMFDSHCQWIFLTTEDLLTEAIDVVYSKSGQSRLLIRCDLDAVSGVFPIKVPLFIDARAKSGTLGALVDEILAAQPNARIIADKVKSPRVTNFTVMKGSNEFEHDDIIIIPQLLHPDHYALLNVTGVFLDRDDVIDLHYRDLVTQAVGRNRGFRESSASDTTTLVVASNRLLKLVLRKMTGTSRVATPPAPDAKRKPWDPPLPMGGGSRVQLYRINRPPWRSG